MFSFDLVFIVASQFANSFDFTVGSNFVSIFYVHFGIISFRDWVNWISVFTAVFMGIVQFVHFDVFGSLALLSISGIFAIVYFTFEFCFVPRWFSCKYSCGDGKNCFFNCILLNNYRIRISRDILCWLVFLYPIREKYTVFQFDFLS